MDLYQFVRDIPDFPRPGVTFKDITPLLNNVGAFRAAVELFVQHHHSDNRKVERIVGIESRGFIFATAVSYALGTPLVLVRKHGKLPHKTIGQSYELEYGTDVLEIHEDAILPGERIAIIDDLMATGGTLNAACKLVERLGGEVVDAGTLLELTFLNGRDRLGARPYYSFLKY